jgi:molecular chaperone HscB
VTEAPRDHFARLGLRPGFDIDPAELQRRYVALQRELHPDRFATKPAAERAMALARASDLNQAYETLKTPLSRAEYLLTLKGRVQRHSIDDPEMLAEAMELREALAEAEDAAAVEALLLRAQGEVAAAETELALAFRADDLDAAGRLAQRLSYLVKLTQEARRRRLRLANAVA